GHSNRDGLTASALGGARRQNDHDIARSAGSTAGGTTGSPSHQPASHAGAAGGTQPCSAPAQQHFHQHFSPPVGAHHHQNMNP
ncbi:unnamed protein product, partial [Amoebophrya sp. A120]